MGFFSNLEWTSRFIFNKKAYGALAGRFPSKIESRNGADKFLTSNTTLLGPFSAIFRNNETRKNKSRRRGKTPPAPLFILPGRKRIHFLAFYSRSFAELNIKSPLPSLRSRIQRKCLIYFRHVLTFHNKKKNDLLFTSFSEHFPGSTVLLLSSGAFL